MSDLQYENFLIGLLTDWISKESSAPGKRFHYPFPNSQDSENLYQAFQNQAQHYLIFNGIQLPYLEIDELRLIYVRHSDSANGDEPGISYSESYISMLRDQVASQAEEFEGTSLLILHNSLLDTLLGTSDDLNFGIWSHNSISQKIISSSRTLFKNKPILEGLLNLQSQLLQEEGSTIFGYRDIYDCLSSGKQIDLRPLGYFNDKELLENWTGNKKQGEERLRKNREIKEKIGDVLHHHPSEVVERLPEFGENFVKKHFNSEEDSNWQDLDFADLEAERRKQTDDVLIFSHASAEIGCKLVGPRTKGDSAAQRRNLHIICLYSDEENTGEITLEFETEKGDLKPEEIKVTNKSKSLLITSSINRRKKGIAQIALSPSNYSGLPEFFALKLVRPYNKECYTFNFLFLKDGSYNVDALENVFLVIPNKQQLSLQTKETELLLSPDLKSGYSLGKNEECIDVNAFGKLDYADLYENSDNLEFTLQSGNEKLKISVEGELHTETLRLPLLMDKMRFGRLFKDDYNGVFLNAKGRVILDNTECRLTTTRRTLLEREEKIIQEHQYTGGDNAKSIDDLEAVFPVLSGHYRTLLAYFTEKKTCPSLVSWGEEFRSLVQGFIESYQMELLSIPKDAPLSQRHRDLMDLGFASYGGKQFITPFHPLVLSYYLHLAESITKDSSYSFKSLPPVTLKRLNPKGLIPFVFLQEDEFGYTQVCEENMLWLEIVPYQDNSYSYVERLVAEKIDEIATTFPCLFKGNDKAPLILNSFNNGQNREVFRGILDFLRKRKDRQQTIHVNVYGSDGILTEFEEFGEMSSYEKIKERYSLSRDDGDHIIDLMRNRLSFSKFTDADAARDEFQWCHIAFYKNNEKVATVSHDLTKHKSGVASNALLSGETSTHREGNHYTAFGLNRVDSASTPHLDIARLVNNLLRPARQRNEHYRDSSGLQLAVSSGFKEQLKKCYRSSLWTTIIDPKVTLSFFESAGDVVLIHYSDQYTNSAGYDAITVTGHVDLYSRVLSSSGKHLLGEFNSFNGEWLLKMVTSNDKIKLERRGIIAAWKVVSSLLNESGIIWIPLSVAEMVRVSGNIGLKITESDFARYHKDDQHKGKMSDDVLFVGLKGTDVYLLPVEVKTGEHNSSSLSKAKEQVQKLRDFLITGFLGPDTLEGNLYRGLFIRQLLMQVEKFELYGVFGEKLREGKIPNREDLLSGNYKIGELSDYATGLVVGILSNKSCTSPSCTVQDSILELKIPQALLDHLLETPLAELTRKIQSREINLPERTYFYPERIEPGEEEVSGSDNPEDEKEQPEVGRNDEPEKNTVPTQQEPLAIQFGTNVLYNQEIIWEPTNTTKVFNTNTGIIGTMGTGKTQFTKSLITQLHWNQADNVGGEPIGILIFDYKADYVKDDFVKATNAKVYELFQLPFNPFSLFGDKPMLPVHTANLFRATMSKAYGLGVKQETKLRTLISEAYEAAGIYAANPSTWANKAPTLEDVWNILQVQEKVEKDSLYAAFNDLIEFQIFQSDASKTISLYEMIEDVTVINLSGYDHQIQNLVVALTLDLFYSQMHINGSSSLEGDFRQISKMILVDEADNFMSQGFESLKKILKEGREFGVGTILSTQELTHFKASGEDYSSYILTWIIHRVAQLKGQEIQSIFNPDNKHEQEAFMQQIRELDKHYSLYVDGDKKVVKMQDLAFWQL